MNTYRDRAIYGTNHDSTEPIRLDPKKPMPHIICPEARPYMEKPPLLFAAIGFILGVATTLATTLTIIFL